MANESSPRREPSSTSRIRKVATPAPKGAEDAAARKTAEPAPVDPTPAAPAEFRDRAEREPYTTEREPSRYREPIRDVRDRNERESGIPVRERLARDRGDRDRDRDGTGAGTAPVREPRAPRRSHPRTRGAVERARTRVRRGPARPRRTRARPEPVPAPVAVAAADGASQAIGTGYPRRGRGPLRRRRDPRPLRGHQARRGPPHRAAEDDDAPAHPDRQGRGGHRVHRPEEAGPDLQDPQGTGQAERPDVRRGDARSPARRLRLPAQPRLQLPPLPRRHLRLAEPDPPLRPARPARSSPGRSARPRRTSATSPCCASRRSTTRTPTS